jgi:hypothetical protein
MKAITASAIVTVKGEIRLREWKKQIEAQQSSGLTVREWCSQNGINPQTYYYRLKKVREHCIEAMPEIVPVSLPQKSGNISIEKNGLRISLPENISPDTLIVVVHELC